MFAKGCKRPDPAKQAAHPPAHLHPRIAARLGAGSPPLPPSADKLPPRPRVDQGQSGSCTAGSTTIAVFTACESLGTPLGFVPSQRLQYAATRALDRAALTPPGGTLPELADEGADIEDAFLAPARYGIRPMLCEKTPDGRVYDLWTDDDVRGLLHAPPANVNAEPQAADLEEAGKTIVKLNVLQHTVQPTDPGASDLLAAALDADPPLPVVACGFVDTAFEQLQPGQVAQAPNQSDSQGGGHAFWLSAYRTNAAGEREFKLENSWGDFWCEGGACWVSMAFVRQLWGIYVMDVEIEKVTS